MNVCTEVRQFKIFLDRYYWQTALLIARSGLARQYRNSFLGHLWTVVQPLTMVVIYAIVMPMIMRLPPSSNYPLYIVVSVPIWSFFATAWVTASRSLVGNAETLKRCTISPTIFVIADVLQHAYRLGVSLTVIYGVTLLLGTAQLDPALLLVPVYFIPVLVITGAIAIAVAFIAPYLRDIGELTTAAMTVFFWLTPVVYHASVLPPLAQAWLRWNPFFIMLHPIQMLAYEHVIPGRAETGRLGIVTGIAILVGFAIYRACRRNYVYYV